MSYHGVALRGSSFISRLISRIIFIAPPHFVSRAYRPQRSRRTPLCYHRRCLSSSICAIFRAVSRHFDCVGPDVVGDDARLSYAAFSCSLVARRCRWKVPEVVGSSGSRWLLRCRAVASCRCHRQARSRAPRGAPVSRVDGAAPHLRATASRDHYRYVCDRGISPTRVFSSPFSASRSFLFPEGSGGDVALAYFY